MMDVIEELGVWVAAAGFVDVHLGDVELLMRQMKRLPAMAVQLLNADLVAGWWHLFFAALNAVKAMRDGTNRSRELGMEFLLYASAQRQISKAIRLMGVRPETGRVALVVIADSRERAETALKQASKLIGGKRDDKILELTKDKADNIKRAFGITDGEIEAQTAEGKADLLDALANLVIEHVALLAAET
ncbi:MAG TPA: hypothetical protein ENF62_02800 [Candidatus Bathyarchaeota archaeon]|nr:hypothetical protein [Candidatus Bathyarchaeota archaeon]